MKQILHRFDPREWVLRPHIELCLSKTPDYRGNIVLIWLSKLLLRRDKLIQAIDITAQISY